MEIWIQENGLSNFIPMGWALFHSLWQSLLVFTMWKISRELWPKMKPQIRYGFGLSFLFLIFSLFCFGVYREYQKKEYFAHHNQDKYPVDDTFYKREIRLGRNYSVNLWESSPIRLAFSIGGFFYIICLFWMGIRLVKSYFEIHRLKKPEHLHPPGTDLLALYEKLKQRIPFSSHAGLWLTKAVSSPITFGYIKPFILFPLGICSKLTLSQMEGLLIHEMAHILRRDYLFNFLQGIVETFLFFNPWVWILSSEIRSEREKCCDDWVSSYYSDSSLIYAQTLLQLEEYRQSSLMLSISALGPKNQLLTRIYRIMKRNESPKTNPFFTGIIAFFLGIFLIGLLSSGKYLNKIYPSKLQIARDRLWIRDTNIHPMKKDTLNSLLENKQNSLQGKLGEEKKIKELIGLEFSEKNLEMDSMGKIAYFKAQEMSKLGELMGIKGKEIHDLVYQHNHKALSEKEFNSQMERQSAELDSLHQILAWKQKEWGESMQALDLKTRELTKMNRLYSNQSPKAYFHFNFLPKASNPSANIPLPPNPDVPANPEPPSDGDYLLAPPNPDLNPIVPSKKLLRIEKKLEKQREKERTQEIQKNGLNKEAFGNHLNNESLKKAIKMGNHYAFLSQDFQNQIQWSLDPDKLSREINQSLNQDLQENLDLKKNLNNQIQLSMDIKFNSDKLKKDIQEAINNTLSVEEKLESSKDKKEIEKALLKLRKAEKEIISTYSKPDLKDLQKKLMELDRSESQNPSDDGNPDLKPLKKFRFRMDFKTDSNGHKDSIRIRKP